jgi:hypothetical protein
MKNIKFELKMLHFVKKTTILEKKNEINDYRFRIEINNKI